MAVKYLYGAAVQGIQGFIFQTNELKDIVGASELVEEICTTQFDEFSKEGTSILRAAGNIKHVFNDVESCREAVLKFPKKVMQFAPGITVSQAVVEIPEGKEFEDVVDDLEKALRTQRNKPAASLTVGLMGIKRSNKTGLPSVDIVVGKGKEDFLDASTKAKKSLVSKFERKQGDGVQRLCNKAFGEEYVRGRNIAYNIEDITAQNDWIAIIHADGNGLGQIVQKIGKSEKLFSEFSNKLDEATRNAAVAAYKSEVEPLLEQGKRIPVRPIVLGGDDFTVVCRADFAVEYASAFMREFESQTQTLLGDMLIRQEVFDNRADKLTACAGIAFIKSSYPFYYGYELAETLCGQAKKDAKEYDTVLAPSCLMFHKVQDSFVEEWKTVEKRELTPQAGLSFKYGPYYTDESLTDKPSVRELIDGVRFLGKEESSAIKSHIRQWMTDLHEDKEMATQKARRVSSLLTTDESKKFFASVTKGKKIGKEKGMETEKYKDMYKDMDKETEVFPAYDLLSLASVKYQETKSQED